MQVIRHTWHIVHTNSPLEEETKRSKRDADIPITCSAHTIHARPHPSHFRIPLEGSYRTLNPSSEAWVFSQVEILNFKKRVRLDVVV